MATTVAGLFLAFHHMDMTDLAANTLLAGPDLFVQDNAAADTCSECHHDEVLISFSAALPHLTESRHVCVVTALYRHSVQQSA